MSETAIVPHPRRASQPSSSSEASSTDYYHEEEDDRERREARVYNALALPPETSTVSEMQHQLDALEYDVLDIKPIHQPRYRFQRRNAFCHADLLKPAVLCAIEYSDSLSDESKSLVAATLESSAADLSSSRKSQSKRRMVGDGDCPMNDCGAYNEQASSAAAPCPTVHPSSPPLPRRVSIRRSMGASPSYSFDSDN